ncbi:uncharacterized protein LOC116262016 isoform X2 [Nymphaea colorata]|uniref:uncharacterized protein LOC116262016 isoform X2 n=1 Tax=Nymphaea colorata TaxID=210225 RepID=UPI00129EC155|nr:uncharacterized protein LOC116262016 isoform X2 [Nymphaea colorata]
MRIRKRSAFLSLLSSDLSQISEANQEHKNEEEEKEGGEGAGRVQHKTQLSDQREIMTAPPSHVEPSKGDLPTIPLQGFQQTPAGNGGQTPAGDDRELETHRHPNQIKDEGEQEDEEKNMNEVGAKEMSNRGARGEHPSRASRRWCTGETVFPLKKRKAIDYRDGSEGDNSNDSNNKISSTNIQNGSDHHSEAAENKWKCSRMNGRGWRCSKPTLVGYSLCEHHLGKGRRIKTMNTLLHGKQASKDRTRKKGRGKGSDDASAGSRSMNSLVSQKISSDHSDRINVDIVKN